MYNHCNFLPDVFDTLTEVVGGVGGEGIYRNYQIFSRIVD